MTCQLTPVEKSLLQYASQLWSSIGHDLCTSEDGCYEDEEVAGVLQDRLREYLEEEKAGTEIAVWDGLTHERKFAICMAAL